MATKITTDKIGKDGGTELSLPSSSQTLPTEGTSNLTVNPSGEIGIGAGSGATVSGMVKYYMDEAGNFSTTKNDITPYHMTHATTGSGTRTWTYVRFGHAGADGSSADGCTILLDGVEYKWGSQSSSAYHQPGNILSIGMEFDWGHHNVGGTYLRMHPVGNCLTSGVSTKAGGDNNYPWASPDTRGTGEYFALTSSDSATGTTSYYNSNSQSSGQYKGCRYQYYTSSNNSAGSIQSTSYGQHYFKVPYDPQYYGFPTNNIEYGFGQNAYFHISLGCVKASTNYTSPQGDAENTNNAYHGYYQYRSEGQIGQQDNAIATGTGNEMVTSSTSYGQPIFYGSFNGFCFTGDNSNSGVSAQFRPYVEVRVT